MAGRRFTFVNVAADLSHLSPMRALFVLEYAKDLNGRAAAVRAGYSPNAATQQASNLLADPEVRAAVDALIADRAAAVKVEATDVLRELWRMAVADPNDLVQYRRTCCRHCWGADFEYQRTAREMARDRREHERDEQRRQAEADRANQAFTPTPFDAAGGDGYRANREPNPECPECCGEGVGDVFVKDTRLLAAEARGLYAGVKRTKDGIELRTHDRKAVLELIGRHLGMFKDKVEVSGQVELAGAILEARRRRKAAADDGCPLA